MTNSLSSKIRLPYILGSGVKKIAPKPDYIDYIPNPKQETDHAARPLTVKVCAKICRQGCGNLGALHIVKCI
jgi:hypothetical protein